MEFQCLIPKSHSTAPLWVCLGAQDIGLGQWEDLHVFQPVFEYPGLGGIELVDNPQSFRRYLTNWF